MRIAAIVHLYVPTHCAGAETMVHSMLASLAKRGHQVDIYTTRMVERLEPYVIDGVTVHPVGSWKPWDLSDAEVIVSHLENVPRAGSIAMQTGAKFVQIIHNTYAQSRLHVGIGADLVVFNSQWMADDMAELVGGSTETVIVRPLADAAEYRTTPGSKVTLVNLYQNKGGDLFWRFARLMPNISFLGVEGAYGHQERRESPDITNVEIWPHASRPMREVFAETKVLLMPSAYESWGRVGVEALCSGIPVIAHPTPGLLESLGEAGIFIDRYRTREWASTIHDLLNDDEAYAVASKRALARAEQLDPTIDMATWCERIEAL